MLRKRLLQLSPGENVFVQGDAANSIFYINSGRVHIHIATMGKSRIIAQLQAGEFLGEHCLGLYPHRPNTATASDETILFEIDRHEMLQALEVQPKLREMFIRNLIDHKNTLEKLFFAVLNL
jgi:CRP/FNR family transcriptional regulator, cyclic AMP receptor protein